MLDKDEIVYKALQAARTDYLAYLLLMVPNFVVAPHFRLLADELMDLESGKTPRLMILMPPRSGKTFSCTENFPSWALGRHPKWQLIAVSHSMNLVEDFSAYNRNRISSPEYQALFPGMELRQDSKAKHKWHTNKSGIFIAATPETNIAGRGAHIGIIDDPLSETSAFSPSEKHKLHRWWPAGFRSRLMRKGRILVINTRWGEDDLSGYLLDQEKKNPKSDKWRVISIPAILDEESALRLNIARLKLINQGILSESYPELEVGGTYWPLVEEMESDEDVLGGITSDELLITKENMPSYQWESLYMQRPVAEEGNIIKRTWWKEWPLDQLPPTCNYTLMSLDTAFSSKETADFSVIQRWGIFSDSKTGISNLILLGSMKGRWEYPELRSKAQTQYNEHKPDMVLIEKKASGQSLLQDLRMANVPVMEYETDKDKISRVHASAPIFKAGRIWAPVGRDWADEVISEMAAFPNASHDDLVDAATQVVLWMKTGYFIEHPDDEWDVLEKNSFPKRRRFYG